MKIITVIIITELIVIVIYGNPALSRFITREIIIGAYELTPLARPRSSLHLCSGVNSFAIETLRLEINLHFFFEAIFGDVDHLC